MRLLRAIIILLITVVIIVLLDNPLGSLPALGKLLDPVNGWAANAEPVSKDFSSKLKLEGIKQPVNVWFEDRLVPHVCASNDHDLYFTQGYLHAYFRLWQMEFQTFAAAGRIGEIIGEKWVIDEKTKQRKNAILEFDRNQRRKGIVYGAENSLKTMEAEARTKEMLDAYTAGINCFIGSLRYKDLPLEYKLMCYKPEPWTNLKTALLLKYMADDLTGYTEDIPLTILREQLPKEEFDYLFPERLKGSLPVIPEGTKFDAPSLEIPKAPGDSVWSHFANFSVSANCLLPTANSETGIGSNNWAISGVHTNSGAPILCNDPHLGLNLPSLWFEMQLQAPGLNVYGVSLPGAPGIVIGFNDSISWGLTNNYRDVKDFYEIEAIDKSFYRFDGKPLPFDKRVEVIKIKGKPDFIDTVYYTLHGPVAYDETFPDPSQSKKKLAMCWMAHRGTNELLSVYLLNRAKDYVSFTEAILHFQCPAQNFVYADRAGNIAMWGQGQFINKWKDQGRYVMKGNTSATLWGQEIPMTENPHVLNPLQGYLASANQVTTDSTYPYWYNGHFSDFRAWRINNILMLSQTGQKYFSNSDDGRLTFAYQKGIPMNIFQNDVTSELAVRLLQKYPHLFSDNDPYYKTISVEGNWQGILDKSSIIATAFQIFWDQLYSNIWSDEFPETSGLIGPSKERTLQLLLDDTNDTLRFFDDKKTSQKETKEDLFKKTYQQTVDSLEKIRRSGGTLEWYKVKGTQLTHLAKLEAFSYKDLKIGGSGNTINAVKKTHGPSWRMIVEMGKDGITAYGVYPGGQSGNPGSKYYGTFVNKWVDGKYYPLIFLPNKEEQANKNIKYTWKIKRVEN